MTATASQLVAPNVRVTATNGITYTYRRFGNAGTSALPLVFFQHFRGNLDNWDPMLVDTIAEQREVILLNNVGVGGSTGAVPYTVQEMAVGAAAFIDALGLAKYDLFGFSLGGFVAQELALIRPHQVRRLVLAGTGPQGGKNMHVYTAGEVRESALRDEPGAEDLLALFFERTETSKAKGVDFLQRIFTRTEGRDEATDLATREAQITAISAWGVPDESKLNRLAAITQPALVANGDNDIMVPTENTHLLGDRLPNAKVVIYPDAGHGFLFQHPVEFAGEVNAFLGH